MRRPALTAMSPRQQEISDRITSRRGGTRGPFLVWLRSPELCEKVEALGAYCRFESSLDLRLRELSLLIAARHFDAQYSWNAHVGKAIEAGVSRESLQALAEHKEPGFTRRDEEVAYQFSTEILGEHFVSDATFAAALEEFGEQGVVDLIGSLGNFSMLAMLLNTFQVDLQPVEPPFPDVRGLRTRPGRAGSPGDVTATGFLPAGLGLFGLSRLEADLEAILGARVDLIPTADLKPGVRACVERDLHAGRGRPCWPTAGRRGPGPANLPGSLHGTPHELTDLAVQRGPEGGNYIDF
jgi:4-carboxymuconolactone decarboxylase